MGQLKSFLGELRRRHVFRVATVYAVVGWLVIQIAVNTFPALTIPDVWVRVVIVMVGLGFPLAVTLAWAFDITPQGVTRTTSGPEESPEVRSAPAASNASGERRVHVPRILRLPQTGRTATHPRPAAAAEPEPQLLSPADPERVRRASIANLRHELRTPLNAILGYSEMLVEDAEASDRPEWAGRFRTLHVAGERILGLVNEALDPSRTSGPGATASVEAVHAELRDQLSRPIQELIVEVQRAVEAVHDSSDADFESDLQRILTASTRLLGLTSEIVDFSRAGRDDSPGEGGSYARARVLAERVMARIRPLADKGAEAVPLRHGHLLVVDDNPMNRDLLGRQLARQGFKVTTAADGREALERMRTHQYDIVLLDVMMPEMDGIEVLDAMQREEQLAVIPVIMISALDEIDSVVRCIEKGAVDYLAKPFDPILLRARIGATLEMRGLREAQQKVAAELAEEREFRVQLLRGVLPARLAERLTRGEDSAADSYEEVSVLVAELDGLGTLAARAGTLRLLERLDGIRSGFVRISAQHAVQTLWLGDRTFVAMAGAEAGEEAHAAITAELALQLCRELVPQIMHHGEPLRVGFGIHSGPAHAGMLITQRLVFGIWGEAVEIAHSLARQSPAGEIQLSPVTAALLNGSYSMQSRGVVQVADSSQLRVFRLAGAADPLHVKV